MNLQLRVLLFIGAVATLLYFFGKIRKNRLDIDYAIFWVLFSGVLVIVSIFPGMVGWLSDLLGFMSPSNMVFLLVIFLLLIKLFSVTIKLSALEHKIRRLSQHIAILEAETGVSAMNKRESDTTQD